MEPVVARPQSASKAAVAAADQSSDPAEEEGVAPGRGDEAEAVGLGGSGEGWVVAGDVGEGLEGGGLVELLEFEPSAGGDDERSRSVTGCALWRPGCLMQQSSRLSSSAAT